MTSPETPPAPDFELSQSFENQQTEQLSIVARQPILDESNAIYGYELFNRLPQAARHTLYSDASLLFNVLSLVEAQTVGQEKPLFINCTHDSLVGRHLELIHPDRVVLELPPVEGHPAQEIESRGLVLGDLHKRGFRFAFDHTVLSRNYAGWRPYASYVKLDVDKLQPEMLEPLVRFAKTQTQVRMIAVKVETEEQHRRMAGFGIQLFQGYWFAKPVLLKAQAVRPSKLVIIQLMNLVRTNADVGEVEEVLKKDPTLSFTLLKYINSSGFGLNTVISSFRHAVMMLGMQKLFRWAALLMTISHPGDGPAAVGGTAVVRGRLMELLAIETGTLGPDECDSAFVVGVFSLLDAMLGIPMEEAIKAISLPQPDVDALLHRTGVFAPLLELTEACESGNEEVFARIANQLQLSNRQVNWAHLQALAWAEEITG